MRHSRNRADIARHDSAWTRQSGSAARRWLARWPVLACVALAACASDGASETGTPASARPGGGKADEASPTAEAPAWLLAPLGQGTWEDDGEPHGGFTLLRAWVDARVANVRYDKRVLAEVHAPYEGGAAMRLLVPLDFEATLGDGGERWGTDAIELYPDGGPHGARLAGPVLYRLRVQHDAAAATACGRRAGACSSIRPGAPWRPRRRPTIRGRPA